MHEFDQKRITSYPEQESAQKKNGCIQFLRAPPSTRTPRKRFRHQTSNGRLPLKHGSDRRETLPKRVSDDPQHFIFRRRKKFFVGIFRS